MLLFSLHVFVFFLVNSPEWSHVSEQEDLSGPCHRGEEQFKGTHTEEGWRAEAEGPPLLLDPVLGTRLSGRSVSERGGSGVKYVSPAVPAVYYS